MKKKKKYLKIVKLNIEGTHSRFFQSYDWQILLSYGVLFLLEVAKMTESQTEEDSSLKPSVKATNGKISYIKVGLHIELQKLGKSHKERKNIFDNLDARVKEAKETENVEIVGIENTKAQWV